jgi:uncharacterized protein
MADLRQPPAIEAFGASGFRIEGVRYDGSVLILSDVVSSWSGEVSVTSLSSVLMAGSAGVELLIVGMGETLSLPPRGLRLASQEAGIGLEMMTTPEAVRLYNLLARDGRRVAAALTAI